jgi:ATP-dependent helicase/nuclease subunit B
MEHLREAGVDPGQAARVEGLTADGRSALALLAGYGAVLDDLARRGYTDRAGRIAAATPHAAGYARRFRLVIHYGAYELIGVNLDLMRALGSAETPVVYLSPGHPTAPAFAFARGYWPEMLGIEPVAIPDRPSGASTPPAAADRLPGARRFGDRLDLLYDDETPPPAADRPLDLYHAQGARAELREAALRILARHREAGTPLSRTAIIARSLEPYAPLLRSVFSEHRLPMTTTASLGAAREPRVQAALFLARCLRDDFPAGPLFDLLRGGALALARDGGRETDAWERLGREHEVAGGERIWTEDLPRWVEARGPRLRDRARRLGSLVGRLARGRRHVAGARTWSEWAERFQEFLAAWIAGEPAEPAAGTPPAAPAAQVIQEALDDAPALEAAGVAFDDSAAIEHLERAAARARLALGSTDARGLPCESDAGGVRVLDAMSSRGLAFDAVYLIGMNADQFPRREREDPFLPDADRRRIRQTLRRPLSIASEAVEEEHLLLAHLAGSARDRLTVSWQRADEEGRARVPALPLREVSRIALGSTDPRVAEARAVRIPAHPGDQSADAVSRHGLLARKEAAFAAALLARGPRASAAILERAGFGRLGLDPLGLLPGLRFLEEIESGETATRYDALPCEPWREEIWSPSRLERLGACPQQFFFRHVLHAAEWEETPAPHEIAGRRMGAAVHDVLRSLYGSLLGDGLLRAEGSREVLWRAAEARLETAWTEHTLRLQARIRRRFPVLWDLISETWRSSLRRFLRLDLAGFAAGQIALEGCESEVTRALPIGPGDEPLTVRGRFDRVGRDRDGGVMITDYKTSGRLEHHVGRLELLRGSRLQMALYVLMAEPEPDGPRRPRVRAEVLGVGPAYADAQAEGAGPARATLDDFDSIRAGVKETIGVLARLARRGLFPLNAESRLCNVCPFTRACRRSHRATLQRLAGLPELRDYFQVLRKTSAKPLLAPPAAAKADR